MAQTSSQYLLSQARDGDRDSFGRLLESVRPYIRVLARGTHRGALLNKVDDSDLVQDAMVEVTKSFHRFRGEAVPEFLAWVREIVAHTVHNSVRHVIGTQKRNPGPVGPRVDPESIPGHEVPPERAAVLREESARVAAAIERLPADMQQVLLMRLVDDVPHAAVAAELGRTEQAVRMLFVRAVRRLQELVGD